MAQAQRIVYYDGVPYIDNAPEQQNMGGMAGIAQMNAGGNRAHMTVDQMKTRGLISPLAPQAPAAPPAPTRPQQPLSQMPQTGWGGAPSAQQPVASMDAILNGQAPQFNRPPPMGGMPQQPQQPQQMPQQQMPQMPQMPSPQRPQQNFDALGQNLMAKILSPNGGV